MLFKTFLLKKTNIYVYIIIKIIIIKLLYLSFIKYFIKITIIEYSWLFLTFYKWLKIQSSFLAGVLSNIYFHTNYSVALLKGSYFIQTPGLDKTFLILFALSLQLSFLFIFTWLVVSLIFRYSSLSSMFGSPRGTIPWFFVFIYWTASKR